MHVKPANAEIKYEPRIRYPCHYNVRHPGECDGQSGYGITKLDGIVEKVIRMKFAEITAASESEILAHQHEREIELARIKLDAAKVQLQEKENDLEDYKSETLKVIRGKSKLSIDLFTMAADTEKEIKAAQADAEAAEQEHAALCESAEKLRLEYDKLLTWADLYDKSTFAAKKMIAAQFVKAVRVGRDCNIGLDFNVSFEAFQSDSRKKERRRIFLSATLPFILSQEEGGEVQNPQRRRVEAVEKVAVEFALFPLFAAVQEKKGQKQKGETFRIEAELAEPEARRLVVPGQRHAGQQQKQRIPGEKDEDLFFAAAVK